MSWLLDPLSPSMDLWCKNPLGEGEYLLKHNNRLWVGFFLAFQRQIGGKPSFHKSWNLGNFLRSCFPFFSWWISWKWIFFWKTITRQWRKKEAPKTTLGKLLTKPARKLGTNGATYFSDLSLFLSCGNNWKKWVVFFPLPHIFSDFHSIFPVIYFSFLRKKNLKKMRGSTKKIRRRSWLLSFKTKTLAVKILLFSVWGGEKTNGHHGCMLTNKFKKILRICPWSFSSNQEKNSGREESIYVK